tara:strand:- start:1117 stop:1875 length:759 start_codon:yes stop_codon:yes gene_type:complete
MIHVLTIHFNSDIWIDLQLAKIKKHIKECKVWSYADGFDISEHKHKFHYLENSKTIKQKWVSANHWTKLNKLTDCVLNDSNTKNDDILIWMDSDAFPVSDVSDYINKKLKKYSLVAVYRPEEAGDVIPHPSFTCSTVEFWKQHKLTWDGVPKKPRFRHEPGTHDSGGQLYFYMLDNNIEWYKMRRSRSLTEHPVFFTIYDNLVYHHGSGSRKNKRWKPSCRWEHETQMKLEYNTNEIFNNIKRDNFNFLESE